MTTNAINWKKGETTHTLTLDELRDMYEGAAGDGNSMCLHFAVVYMALLSGRRDEAWTPFEHAAFDEVAKYCEWYKREHGDR